MGVVLKKRDAIVYETNTFYIFFCRCLNGQFSDTLFPWKGLLAPQLATPPPFFIGYIGNLSIKAHKKEWDH